MRISDTGSRWEVEVDGRVVDIADYELQGSQIDFTHTAVDPECQGRGVAGALVEKAVGDARRRALEVVPQCPFVRTWVHWHPAC